nr:MAG TPA: hypothetical protein [Caudoviricetes sp.]
MKLQLLNFSTISTVVIERKSVTDTLPRFFCYNPSCFIR